MSILTGFITGQSIPDCTELSVKQRAFLDASIVPKESILRYNFPWRKCATPVREISLLEASWNNIRFCLGSMTPHFRTRFRDETMARIAGYDRVVLLAGSCGLELLDNLRFPVDLRKRLHVFAYGPVSRRVPLFASCRIIQGRNDHLSRIFHDEADHIVTCGHLDYLEQPETLAHFNSFYRTVIT